MTTRVVTTSRLLVSVDWLHRCKLPLHVPDGGLCCPMALPSPVASPIPTTARPPSRMTLLTSAKSRQISPGSSAVRDGADGKAGPLLGVTGIAGAGLPGLPTASVQRWQSFMVHLVGASSPACHGLTGWQERPMTPQPFRASLTAGRGGAARGGVDEPADHDQQAERQQDK